MGNLSSESQNPWQSIHAWSCAWSQQGGDGGVRAAVLWGELAIPITPLCGKREAQSGLVTPFLSLQLLCILPALT